MARGLAADCLEAAREPECLLDSRCARPGATAILVSAPPYAGFVRRSKHGTKLKWRNGTIQNLSVSTRAEE
jgi:hypothetical protein